MTQLCSNNAIQFKVNDDESFNCRFKLPKELVSIFQKLDDKRLVKTEVKTYDGEGGMRFDLTFVNKKNKKKIGSSGFPFYNLLSFMRSTNKLKDKIAYLEFKVLQLCKRLEELQCIECKEEDMGGDPSGSDPNSCSNSPYNASVAGDATDMVNYCKLNKSPGRRRRGNHYR